MEEVRLFGSRERGRREEELILEGGSLRQRVGLAYGLLLVKKPLTPHFLVNNRDTTSLLKALHALRDNC
jgi:hypothetical protein